MLNQVQTLAVLVFSLALIGCGTSDGQGAATSNWQVVATEAGERPIAALKAIRKVTDLGLQEAKELAESSPSVIISGVSKDDAEIFADELRSAGMTIELRREQAK